MNSIIYITQLRIKQDKCTFLTFETEIGSAVVECLTRDGKAVGSSSPASLPCGS